MRAGSRGTFEAASKRVFPAQAWKRQKARWREELRVGKVDFVLASNCVGSATISRARSGRWTR